MLSREQRWQVIKNNCLIREGPHNIVFSVGSIDSRVMIVGEAPGAEEVIKNEPFVGDAGKILTDGLESVGISRTDLYITNAVKRRPTKLSDKGNIVNTTPNQKMIDRFNMYLRQEIELIDPDLIVILGATSYKAVHNVSAIKVSDIRGKFITTSIGNKKYKTFCMLHPASLIYSDKNIYAFSQDLDTLQRYILKNKLQDKKE